MSQIQKKCCLTVVLRSPILRSQDIVSDILRVEHHYQPVNRESECCSPNCLLSIHLGQPIQLERTIDGRRSREHLAEGDIDYALSASPTVLGYWCGILLLRFEPKLFTSVLYESVDADRTQIVPQLKICDPSDSVHWFGTQSRTSNRWVKCLYAESTRH